MTTADMRITDPNMGYIPYTKEFCQANFQAGKWFVPGLGDVEVRPIWYTTGPIHKQVSTEQAANMSANILNVMKS